MRWGGTLIHHSYIFRMSNLKKVWCCCSVLFYSWLCYKLKVICGLGTRLIHLLILLSTLLLSYVLADDCDIFISYSHIRAFQQDSPNSVMDANKLYDYLVKIEGLKPWIDKNRPTLGDNLSRKVLSALKRCRAIIPIVTRGYARSLQCVRELYYFALLHPNQPCYPMMSEFHQYEMERDQAGKWLLWQMNILGCFHHRETEQLISSILKLKVQM